MYRVAVIQNENEVLRSGYANVIPKLNDIKRLSQYSFELFDVVNIFKLFQDGDSNLKNFDSIIITTNSTSETVLSILRENNKAIEDFITKGKGVFIASQKKLSTSKFDLAKDDGRTLFLPDLYDFFTVERPREEKDSGVGNISILSNEQNLLLNYPTSVTVEMTKKHCENNAFKRHFYRSHIVPKTVGAYHQIFVDTSYEKANNRNLLMVNLVPQNGERIVISTIAIDWEFHENLLTNIITYITEGLPKVAFIDNAKTKNGDFDFLFTSAKLSKISHEVYNHPNSIRKELFNVHNTYIFSPDWSENEIGKFLKQVESNSFDANKSKKSYVRVYYFKKIEKILTLSQYSNFSTIDLITDSSVLWVNSKFPNKMWNNSFWTTYDILFMLSEIGVDIKTYITPILKDVKRHFGGDSYDGVTGATCGLIEVMILLQKSFRKELESENYTDKELNGMINWVVDKFESQSIYDKQTVILTLTKYKSQIDSVIRFDDEDKKFQILKKFIKDDFELGSWNENYTETDLCRRISLCLLNTNKGKEINESINYLKKNQTVVGKWTNTGRTANVLIFLLENFEKLESISEINVRIDDMIYNGILYLRSEYDWKKSNWDNDIQATAKAIHAIGLYNKHFKYSTQDFFKTLEIDSDKIYSASIVHNVSESMRNLRQHSNELASRIETVTAENRANQILLKEQQDEIEASIKYETEIAKQIIRIKTISTILGSLFVAFVFYLWTRYPARVAQEFRQIDITGIILGFVVGLVLTSVAQMTVGKAELLKKVTDRKKKNKK